MFSNAAYLLLTLHFGLGLFLRALESALATLICFQRKLKKPQTTVTSLRSKIFMLQAGIGRGQKMKSACTASGSSIISPTAELSSFCLHCIRRTEALPPHALGNNPTYSSGITSHMISSGKKSVGRRDASAYHSHHRHAGS